MLNKALSENLEKTEDVQIQFSDEISKHKADKAKFRDINFLPKTPVKPEDKQIITSSVEWDRVEKIYEQCTNVDNRNCEIRRGALKDDALIAVFSALLNDHDKIMDWFKQPIDIASGIICVNIPFKGKKVSIIVDTKVPKQDGKPLLSKPVRAGFPWSCFIEKALAKLLGSFSALEQLTVKEILFHIFGYSSKTIMAPSASDRLLEEVGNLIKQSSVAFVTIGDSKDSDEAGLNPGSTFIIQNVIRNKSIFVLLFNPGKKRRFISTFEERIDKWKQDAKFPKVKDDAFVFRASAIQKYTESVIIGSPAVRSQVETKLSAEIKEGQTICEKQYALKSDKFANINFIVECNKPCLHEVTILENGRLKARFSTSDTIDFFMVRTDPEKSYKIAFSASEPCVINSTLCTDSAFTTNEEEYKADPLMQVGTGLLICGKTDGRYPNEPSNLACLPQWKVTFTEPGKISCRIINKTICEAKHYFFLAGYNGERFRVKGDGYYSEHFVEGNKDAAEWEFEITDVSKPYVFGCYRGQANVSSTFDFELHAEKPLVIEKLEYINQNMNIATIDDKIASSKYDCRSPISGNPGITRLKQWVLKVDQEQKVFVSIEHDEGKHSVCIQEGEMRINHFAAYDHYLFESDSKYDVFEFNAKAGAYTVAVIREPIKAVTEYKVNFYSNANLTVKQLPTLTTEKCRVFSRDVRFQENEGDAFFPMETTEIPEKQYYLVVPKSGILIGNIEPNSTQDESTYCLYIEDNDGKRIKEINTSHNSEHAIGNKEAKEWFTFEVKCDDEKGAILTFCVTRKGATRRASVAVRFFSQNNLSISSAQNDLSEDMKADFVKATKETPAAATTTSLSRRASLSEATRSAKTLPSAKENSSKQNVPQSNCCLLF